VVRGDLAESALLPHAIPASAERDLAALREVSVSMGLMLDTTSDGCWRRAVRIRTRPTRCRAAPEDDRARGQALRSLTTGILIGIGETPRERADALVAIRDLHERYGHVQEVIGAELRAKRFIR